MGCGASKAAAVSPDEQPTPHPAEADRPAADAPFAVGTAPPLAAGEEADVEAEREEAEREAAAQGKRTEGAPALLAARSLQAALEPAATAGADSNAAYGRTVSEPRRR